MMNEKIRESFQNISAPEELKKKTGEAVFQKMRKKRKSGFRAPLAFAAAVVLMAAAGTAGYVSYFTPVAAVSIDTESSLEIELNRYDRVISVIGYDTASQQLADSLSLKHLSCEAALAAIMGDENIAAAAEDGKLSVTVVGEESRCMSIEDRLCSGTGLSSSEIDCSDEVDTIENARSMGMSVGKYRAYLQLLESGSDLTEEEAQGMSTCELHRMLEGGGSGGGHGKGHHHGSA